MTSGDESGQARAVRSMFGSIAGKYDLLNHLLSVNVDRLWRTACVRKVAGRIGVERPRILDIGCGTADLSLSFSRLGPVVGCDFCHPMLVLGKKKIARAHSRNTVLLLEGDALCLPLADRSFDAVVSAFVLRNLVNMKRGLTEMHRVLRPGGVLGILDFAMPRTPLLGSLYRFYFANVLPKIGKWLSGVEGPYQYLPSSVQAFPPPDKIAERIREAGFSRVGHDLLTGGVAVFYSAARER